MTTERSVVGAGNEEQYDAWNSEEGARWAANAAYHDAAVRQHHDRLTDAAAVGADDRVLDIGCGTGQCTRDAARRAFRGTAVGIDLSLPMIGAAERRARDEGVLNATFVHGDAQVQPFAPDVFDVAFSRFGSMLFADQVGAFLGMPPTGKTADFGYIDLYRIAAGRLVEVWHIEDIAGLMRQLNPAALAAQSA